MLTNPHDTFRGQSRSPNIVPFHMLSMVSYFPQYIEIFDFRNAVTFKLGWGSLKIIFETGSI